MQLNSKKELRLQRIERALKANLKKRKIFQNKINKEIKKIKLISNYRKGDWWVQDFSSTLPLHLTLNLNNKNIMDLCSAPGGKAFQAISQGGHVILNDKNKKRLYL